MRFLVDQDVYKLTVDKLREWKHDVVTAKELGMARASDEDLLALAREQNRILMTRDKGFGGLLFLKEEVPSGVIFLRITPRTLTELHKQLRTMLKEHSGEELMRYFSVVEPGRHRIRQLPI